MSVSRRHLVFRIDDVEPFVPPGQDVYQSQHVLGQENSGLHDCFLNCGRLAPRELALCRVGELSFAARPGWATSPNACFLRPDYIVGGADQNPYDLAHPELGPVLPFFQDLPANLTGATIGMWSTGPDEALEDTKVWWRPTSTGFLGALREGAHAAADLGRRS